MYNVNCLLLTEPRAPFKRRLRMRRLNIRKVTVGYRKPVARHASPLVVRIIKACWNSEPNKTSLLISNLHTGHVIGKD